jgi:hypothetical protein
MDEGMIAYGIYISNTSVYCPQPDHDQPALHDLPHVPQPEVDDLRVITDYPGVRDGVKNAFCQIIKIASTLVREKHVNFDRHGP